MELERAAEDKVQLTERSGEAGLSCVCLRDTGQNVRQSLRRRLDSVRQQCRVTILRAESDTYQKTPLFFWHIVLLTSPEVNIQRRHLSCCLLLLGRNRVMDVFSACRQQWELGTEGTHNDFVLFIYFFFKKEYLKQQK